MLLIPTRNKFSYQRRHRAGMEEQDLPCVTEVIASAARSKNPEPRNPSCAPSPLRLIGVAGHAAIDRFLKDRPLPVPRSWSAIAGYQAAYSLIHRHFHCIDELWGTSTALWYKGRYSGVADCLAVHRDTPSVLEFKFVKMMPSGKALSAYFMQCAAYAKAHNHEFGTCIEQGVVLVHAENGQTKEFVSRGSDFLSYGTQWEKALSEYAKKKPMVD